jgi:hypothetical protein
VSFDLHRALSNARPSPSLLTPTRRYCDQLTQLPKSEEWSLNGSQERMGAQEWEVALQQKIDPL